MNNLVIMDYKNVKTIIKDVDLDNLRNINTIYINVVSGDEVAKVSFSNGDSLIYDSSRNRKHNIYDGEYVLYSKDWNRPKKSRVMNEFLSRKNSYSMSNYFI